MSTQRVAFIVMELDSVLMRACLPTRRVQAILFCLDPFRQGWLLSAQIGQCLLGLLTAALLFIPLGPDQGQIGQRRLATPSCIAGPVVFPSTSEDMYW